MKERKPSESERGEIKSQIKSGRGENRTRQIKSLTSGREELDPGKQCQWWKRRKRDMQNVKEEKTEPGNKCNSVGGEIDPGRQCKQ